MSDKPKFNVLVGVRMSKEQLDIIKKSKNNNESLSAYIRRKLIY